MTSATFQAPPGATHRADPAGGRPGALPSDADLCRLSEAVYLPTWFEVGARVDAMGMEVLETFDHADSEAMLVRAPRHQCHVLVFRGTEASRWHFTDLRRNLPGWPTRWSGRGRVHPGYQEALSRILPRMLGQSCQPLVVTGHSLGGAMAHLYAAIACELVDLAPAAVVTFGAPAAFWGDDSRAAITCPLRRYVMPGDPAPWLPPLFTQPGKPLLLPVPADAPRLPWRRWWWAHDPATYLAGLEASEHRIIPAAEAALKEG